MAECAPHFRGGDFWPGSCACQPAFLKTGTGQMKIAITGASGHIGNNLVRTLIKRGIHPRVLVHKDQKSIEGLAVDRFEGDITDKDVVCRFCESADVVFHLAAVITLAGRRDLVAEAVNVGGTENVVSACLENKVNRLVHFSSIHALSDFPLDVPVDETRELAIGREFLPYNRSKARGEQVVLDGVKRGLSAVIINPTSVLGPNDFHLSAMGRTVLDLARGRLPALVSAGYDFVDVRDVVDGALVAMERGKVGERYLLSGRRTTFTELAQIIASFTGVPAPTFVSPMWLARMGAPFVSMWSWMTHQEPRYTSVSLKILRGNTNVLHDKAMKELNFNPRPLKQTLAATIEWFRQVGLVPAQSIASKGEVAK